MLERAILHLSHRKSIGMLHGWIRTQLLIRIGLNKLVTLNLLHLHHLGLQFQMQFEQLDLFTIVTLSLL